MQTLLFVLSLISSKSCAGAFAGPARRHERALGLCAETTAASIPWRIRAQDVFRKDKRPVILFDGVCNMCNGGVNFALDWDVTGEFRFAALQSETGRALLQRSGRQPDDISSIVLVEEYKACFKSDAVLRIAKNLRAPFPVAVSGPRFLEVQYVNRHLSFYRVTGFSWTGLPSSRPRRGV